MFFIIVFSRQKQLSINAWNFTNGKQLVFLIDPIKYWNRKSELQAKSKEKSAAYKEREYYF